MMDGARRRSLSGRDGLRVCGLVTARAHFLLTCVLFASGCSTTSSKKASARNSGAGKVSQEVAPVPHLRPGPPTRSTPRTADPAWRAAMAGEPIDLGLLARREGAIGLLAAVDLGGSLALTALKALPSAPDAEAALGRLCALLRAVPPAEAEPVLLSVHAIVGRGLRDAERLDPDGARSCAAALEAAGRDGELGAHGRDLATSARVLLAEHSAPP